MSIDDQVEHWFVAVQTQNGIIEYVEAMAQVLAEAGRASNRALGDAPELAVGRWSDVIRKRALEILREQRYSSDDYPIKPLQKKILKQLVSK